MHANVGGSFSNSGRLRPLLTIGGISSKFKDCDGNAPIPFELPTHEGLNHHLLELADGIRLPGARLAVRKQSANATVPSPRNKGLHQVLIQGVSRHIRAERLVYLELRRLQRGRRSARLTTEGSFFCRATACNILTCRVGNAGGPLTGRFNSCASIMPAASGRQKTP